MEKPTKTIPHSCWNKEIKETERAVQSREGARVHSSAESSINVLLSQQPQMTFQNFNIFECLILPTSQQIWFSATVLNTTCHNKGFCMYYETWTPYFMHQFLINYPFWDCDVLAPKHCVASESEFYSTILKQNKCGYSYTGMSLFFFICIK